MKGKIKAPIFCAFCVLCAQGQAAVPVAWTNAPGMAPHLIGPYPHGSSIEFAVTLRGYTEPPIAAGADLRLWFQTNGMGKGWWSAPASLDGNVITSTFGPAQDTGADRVSLFFGAPGNMFAPAVLRLTHAPGFAPNSLGPPDVLDWMAELAAVSNAMTVAIEAGWMTDWTVLRDGVDVSAQVGQPRYDAGEGLWYTVFVDGDYDGETDVNGAADATLLTWEGWRDEEGEYVVSGYTATRSRVAGPRVTKVGELENDSGFITQGQVQHQQLALRAFGPWTFVATGVQEDDSFDSDSARLTYVPDEDPWMPGEWSLENADNSGIVLSGEADATELTFTARTAEGAWCTVTATRTRPPGYILGSQTGKPLAAAEEVEALKSRLSLSSLPPFDFADMRGVYLSISNVIHALGGSVTNFPSFSP